MQELCDNNSAAWLNEDGTLSEEKVKEFLEQAGRIYKAGEDGLNEFKEKYAQEFADSEEAPYNRLKMPVKLLLTSVGNCWLICCRRRFFSI